MVCVTFGLVQVVLSFSYTAGYNGRQIVTVMRTSVRILDQIKQKFEIFAHQSDSKTDKVMARSSVIPIDPRVTL